MGIVRRQSVRSSIISYLGILIGFISQTFIYTNLLSSQIIGLIRVFQSFGGLFSELSQMSIQTITAKFFPYFRNKDKGHQGFLYLGILLVTSGFVLMFLLALIFQSSITQWYSEQSPLFVKNYFYAFPIALCLVYITLFEAYLKMLYNIVYSAFVKEVYIRIFTLTAVILFYLKILSFTQFLILFCGGYAIAVILLVLYLISIREFFIKPDFSLMTRPFVKEIAKYASFTYLIVLVHRSTLELDKLIIASIGGLSSTGIYSVTSLMANVIAMPMTAIANISGSLVSEAHKNNDMAKIKELYQKSSLNMFIAGAFLFLLIWLNSDNIFHYMPDEYQAGKYVIFFIGMAKLLEMICGINSGIIILSNFYNFMLFSSLITLAFMVGANIILIKKIGIIGAALATLSSVFLHNFIKVTFIWIKMKIQPFSFQTFKALGVFAFVWIAGIIIPFTGNAITDTIVRTGLILVLFWPLILLFKVSDDFNKFYSDIAGRIKQWI